MERVTIELGTMPDATHAPRPKRSGAFMTDTNSETYVKVQNLEYV